MTITTIILYLSSFFSFYLVRNVRLEIVKLQIGIFLSFVSQRDLFQFQSPDLNAPGFDHVDILVVRSRDHYVRKSTDYVTNKSRSFI